MVSHCARRSPSQGWHALTKGAGWAPSPAWEAKGCAQGPQQGPRHALDLPTPTPSSLGLYDCFLIGGKGCQEVRQREMGRTAAVGVSTLPPTNRWEEGCGSKCGGTGQHRTWQRRNQPGRGLLCPQSHPTGRGGAQRRELSDLPVVCSALAPEEARPSRPCTCWPAGSDGAGQTRFHSCGSR